jgi:hypothetical protein
MTELKTIEFFAPGFVDFQVGERLGTNDGHEYVVYDRLWDEQRGVMTLFVRVEKKEAE